MKLHTGTQTGFSYGFSRYTEVPGDPSRWSWFLERLKEGHFLGVHPVTGVPVLWSLRPEDTEELIFWTKNPVGLIESAHLLREEFPLSIHVTVTGNDSSLERSVPSPERAAQLLEQIVSIYGSHFVTWRISPYVPGEGRIPLPDLFERMASTGVTRVAVSFYQEHPGGSKEGSRFSLSLQEKVQFWEEISTLAKKHRMLAFLCKDDEIVSPKSVGICTPTARNQRDSGCGCSLSVDAFTATESCVYGCVYCYAVDRNLAPKRRNTLLPLLLKKT